MHSEQCHLSCELRVVVIYCIECSDYIFHGRSIVILILCLAYCKQNDYCMGNSYHKLDFLLFHKHRLQCLLIWRPLYEVAHKTWTINFLCLFMFRTKNIVDVLLTLLLLTLVYSSNIIRPNTCTPYTNTTLTIPPKNKMLTQLIYYFCNGGCRLAFKFQFLFLFRNQHNWPLPPLKIILDSWKRPFTISFSRP